MIRLHLNENPYILSKQIREEINFAIRHINKYPMEMEDKVIQKISKKNAVAKSNILLTQGIDEAMDRLIGQFSKMRFVIFSPTFDGYISRLKANGQKYLVLKLDKSFKIKKTDIERIERNDFVVIANPNNPTGNLFEDSIKLIRKRCGKLLIDEAYFDFSDGKSYLDECDRDGNLFIFRSFSKTYALAGLRVGWLCGKKEDIGAMKDKQWFCNINFVSLIILYHILEHEDFKHYVAKILREKAYLARAVSRLGFHARETKTNFFLLKYHRVKLLVEYLQKKGILVKDTSVLGLDGYIRISVGTFQNNKILIKALKQFNNYYEKK